MSIVSGLHFSDQPGFKMLEKNSLQGLRFLTVREGINIQGSPYRDPGRLHLICSGHPVTFNPYDLSFDPLTSGPDHRAGRQE